MTAVLIPLTFAFMVYNGIMDLRLREVNNLPAIILSVIGIVITAVSHDYATMVIWVMALASAILFNGNERIGGADVDALLITVAACQQYYIPMGVSLIAAILWRVIRREKKMPYLFCLLIGWTVYMLFYLIAKP